MKLTIISQHKFNNGKVFLNPLGSSKKYTIDAKKLAILIAEKHFDFRGLDKDIISYKKWYDNGWGESVPFYLSTLDGKYEDAGCNFNDVHKKVLADYADKDDFPSELIPNSEIVYELQNDIDQNFSRKDILVNRRTTYIPQGSRLKYSDISHILLDGFDKLSEFRTIDNQKNPLNALVNFGPSLDIYVVVYSVEGMDEGIYRYDLVNKNLLQIDNKADRKEFQEALVGQPAPLTSSVSVIYVSDVKRHQWRYRHERALRGLWIDTAKVTNELLWKLASLAITPHITPAFRDSRILGLLGLPADLSYLPVYAVSFKGPNKNHE